MLILAYIALGFLALRLLVTIINLSTFPLLGKAKWDSQGPDIAVLIPVRNEEKNISFLLDDLLQQSYKPRQILLYDDQSEDSTPVILQEYEKKHAHISWIAGDDLPPDWVGKNYACYRLAHQADADYLLFLDADVRLKKDLIRDALFYCSKNRLALLSLFPVQKMYSFGEKITVPVMNMILISLLPLILTRKSSWKAFSAANGQCMLFENNIYREQNPHEIVKDIAVEDIEIFKIYKKKKLKTETMLGGKQISCRMYQGFKEAVEGFTKNFLHFFGNTYIFSSLFMIISTLGLVFIVLSMQTSLILLYLLMLLSVKVIVSILSHQNIVQNLVYAPFQLMAMWIIYIHALRFKSGAAIVWKGRSIK
jgi:glycosyltransferase involved in cell wall biosynthesis